MEKRQQPRFTSQFRSTFSGGQREGQGRTWTSLPEAEDRNDYRWSRGSRSSAASMSLGSTAFAD